MERGDHPAYGGGREQIAGFNLYHREIVTESAPCFCKANSSPPQKKDEGWTKVNPALITGENPYAYTDGNVHGGITYEYKLEAVLADESTEILGTASCAPTPPSFAITSLYPNPASDVLNITLALPQIGDVNLELYDLTGRLVESQNLSVSSVDEVSFKLDMSGLANGLYTLRATQSDEQAIKQVVVTK